MLPRFVQCAAAMATLLLAAVLSASAATPAAVLHVSAATGSDTAPGTLERPLRSLSAAIALLPDPLTASVTIEVAPVRCTSTGGVEMPDNRLDLMRRMRPSVSVRIVGSAGPGGARPVLTWEGGDCMVDAREGDWWLESIDIGSGSTRQRRGVMVSGPAHVTLKDVSFHTRSQSDAAIYSRRSGRVSLRGAISINPDYHDKAPDGDSFSGIIATDHGSVAFEERAGSGLSIGNGSLSAEYYGVIELKCESARITSWGDQSNCLAINDSGRIDLHGTPTRLCAKKKGNTPIGLEHDGHILAEGAHIAIEGDNDHAIVLQKASTFFCNDVELKGTYRWALSAMSGSTLLAGFVGDVAGGIEADTSAHITVERIAGTMTGRVEARRGASIALPDRNVVAR